MVKGDGARKVRPEAPRPLPSEEAHRNRIEIEDAVLPLDPEFQVRDRQASLAELLAGELRRKGKVLQEVRLLPFGEPQAAHVQVEVPGLEYFPGFFVRVEEGAVREENFRHVQGESRPLGLLGRLLPDFLLRCFEVEFSVAVLLDGDPGALHPDLYDPDFLVEEGEKFDPEDGLLRGGDVCPPVPDAHILQRDVEAGEEADPQPAADADFHPQGVGGGRLQPGLVRVHIHEENKRDRRQDEEAQRAPRSRRRRFSVCWPSVFPERRHRRRPESISNPVPFAYNALSP